MESDEEISEEISGVQEEYVNEYPEENEDDFQMSRIVIPPGTRREYAQEFEQENQQQDRQDDYGETEEQEQVFMEGYQGGQRLGGELEESLKIQTYIKNLRLQLQFAKVNEDDIKNVKNIKRYWKLNPETLAQSLKIYSKLGKYNSKGNKTYNKNLKEQLVESAKSKYLDETNIFRYYKLLSK